MRDWPLDCSASDGWTRTGTVRAVSARSIHVRMPGLTPGAFVLVERPGKHALGAEVVNVSSDCASCIPLEPPAGVVAGARATSTLARIGAFVGDSLLGQATDAWGRCAGDSGARVVAADPPPLLPEERSAIRREMRTGVAAIDAFATLGYGQRIALFAGAGVGKSTLLRRIVERARVDARVVALIGERGREAAELLDRFANDGRRSTTAIVCATAEAPPYERMAAARTATAQAEALARDGRDVLLVVDSLTRVAAAWREHAIAGGEPPAHRGHPPSLSGFIARIVERAGARPHGSITGVYAVLVDGDDPREPVTDAVRALLDGHIVLSRQLAESGRFPAIDVLRSLSRLMNDVASRKHVQDAATVRAAIATLERAEDLFAIGAYRPGGDLRLDAALRVRDAIESLVFDGCGGAHSDDAAAALACIAARLAQVP
jgi:FliI/YscN family ATPase